MRHLLWGKLEQIKLELKSIRKDMHGVKV